MPKSIEAQEELGASFYQYTGIEAPESIESPRRAWGFVLPVHRTEAIESPKESLGLRFTCAMGAEARVNRKPKEKLGTSYYLWSAGQAKTK